MSALKFKLVDLIASPDDYTSGERKQAAAAMSALIDKAAAVAGAIEFRIDDQRAAMLDGLRTALADVGGAR